MSIDSQDTGSVLHNNLSALIKAEHARYITVLLGAVPNFGLVDFLGKVLPHDTGQLHPDADVDLVIFQGNGIFGTPLCKETAADAANGKKNVFCRYRV